MKNIHAVFPSDFHTTVLEQDRIIHTSMYENQLEYHRQADISPIAPVQSLLPQNL